MTMADRVAVMNGGRVLQVASPVELYDRPLDGFVAAFIGTMNFLPGDAADGGIEVDRLGLLAAPDAGLPPGSEAQLAIRPEAARILEPGESPASDDVVVEAVVEGVAFVGSQVHTHLVLAASGHAFVVTANRRRRIIDVGERVRVAWPSSAGRVLAP